MNLKHNVKASSFCALISFSILSVFMQSCDGTSSSKNAPNQINNGDVTAANTLTITRPSGSCESDFCFYNEIKNKTGTITVSPTTGSVSSFMVNSSDPSISVDTSQCGTTEPISITAANPCNLIVNYNSFPSIKLKTANPVTLTYTYTNNLGNSISKTVDYTYEFGSVFSTAVESTTLSSDTKFWTKNSNSQIVTQNSNGISVYDGAGTSPSFTNNTLSFFDVSETSLYGAKQNTSTISSIDLKTGTESVLATMHDYLFNSLAIYSNNKSNLDIIYATASQQNANYISLCSFSSGDSITACIPISGTNKKFNTALLVIKNSAYVSADDTNGHIYISSYVRSTNTSSLIPSPFSSQINGSLPDYYATQGSMAFDENTSTLFVVTISTNNVYTLSAINSSGNILSSYSFASGIKISKPFLTQNGSVAVLNSDGTVYAFSKDTQGQFDLTKLANTFPITGFTGSVDLTLLTNRNNQLLIPVASTSQVVTFNLDW